MPGDSLNELKAKTEACTLCKLAATRTKVVFGEGNPHARLMFIGEGPGKDEDASGRPFIGRAGQLLTRIIENALKLRREDVYIANVVKCRPTIDGLGKRDRPLRMEASGLSPAGGRLRDIPLRMEAPGLSPAGGRLRDRPLRMEAPGMAPARGRLRDRAPEADEVAACAPYLREQIALISPEVIVTLGNPSTRFLLQTKEGITKLRGKWHEYNGIPVMPTYHPSFLLRNGGDGADTPYKRDVWNDMAMVSARMVPAVARNRLDRSSS